MDLGFGPDEWLGVGIVGFNEVIDVLPELFDRPFWRQDSIALCRWRGQSGHFDNTVRAIDVTRKRPRYGAFGTRLAGFSIEGLSIIARFLTRNIPHATLIELEGADHMCWFGDNATQIADTILDFILEPNCDTRTAATSRRILATILTPPGSAIPSCACRKSNPDILVMQPAQDRTAKNVSSALNGARRRCNLVQR